MTFKHLPCAGPVPTFLTSAVGIFPFTHYTLDITAFLYVLRCPIPSPNSAPANMPLLLPGKVFPSLFIKMIPAYLDVGSSVRPFLTQSKLNLLITDYIHVLSLHSSYCNYNYEFVF